MLTGSKLLAFRESLSGLDEFSGPCRTSKTRNGLYLFQVLLRPGGLVGHEFQSAVLLPILGEWRGGGVDKVFYVELVDAE